MRKRTIILVLGWCFLIGVWWWVNRSTKNNKNIDYLNGNHYPKQELEETFEENKTKAIEGVQAVITSHHYLAKDLIAKTLATVDGEKVEEVILVSPDHFK